MSATPPVAVTSGPADVVVTIVGQDGSMSFSPNPVSLRVGLKIAWRNGDTIVHHVVQDDNGGGGAGGGGGYGGGGGSSGVGFDVGQISAGATSSALSFTAAGTVNYHCSIHPTMTGTITITN
jgi:plastocyanin